MKYVSISIAVFARQPIHAQDARIEHLTKKADSVVKQTIEFKLLEKTIDSLGDDAVFSTTYPDSFDAIIKKDTIICTINTAPRGLPCFGYTPVYMFYYSIKFNKILASFPVKE